MARPKSTKSAQMRMAYPSGTLISIQQGTAVCSYKSDKTIRELIESGQLMAYRLSQKPGSAIRILVDDLYALLSPVIPEAVYADVRSRQPSPLHPPLPGSGAR